MTSSVLIGPAAPWLIAGLAPALERRVTTFAQMFRDQVGALVDSVGGERILVVAAGSARQSGIVLDELPHDLGPSPYGLSVRSGDSDGIDTDGADSVGSGGRAPELPGVCWVARSVLGTAAASLAVLGDGTARPAVLSRIQQSPTAILVLGDGSFAHGEHAPGAPDPRAAAFDEDLAHALRSGPTAFDDSGAFAAADGSTWSAAAARQLGAGLPAVLGMLRSVLDVAVVASAVPHVIPYGVAHHLVRWDRR